MRYAHLHNLVPDYPGDWTPEEIYTDMFMRAAKKRRQPGQEDKWPDERVREMTLAAIEKQSDLPSGDVTDAAKNTPAIPEYPAAGDKSGEFDQIHKDEMADTATQADKDDVGG